MNHLSGHGNVTGLLFVDADAVAGAIALEKWVKLSLAYMRGLPKKAAKAKPKRRDSFHLPTLGDCVCAAFGRSLFM